MDRCSECPRRKKPRCNVCGNVFTLSVCPCCAVPPRANCEDDKAQYSITLTYIPDCLHVKAAHILRMAVSACRSLPAVKDGLTLAEAVQAIKALIAIGGKCSVSPDLLDAYPEILACPLRRKLILNM